MLGAAILGSTAACGSSARLATAPSPTTPFLRKPPPEVGDGLVCAAAADRLLGIPDGFDMRQFTRGSARPQSPNIQHDLAQYLVADKAASRDQAAGLIQGQCAAFGFYVTTYQECVQSMKSKGVPLDTSIRGCIERRRWTVYIQQ